MEIITWIVVGALVGWLAFLVTKTSPERGVALVIVVGSLGAVIGGWLADYFGGMSGLSLYGFLAAIVGAIVFVGISSIFQFA